MAKKRDFDAFYYGVGMKLDQQSIDAVGEQLEGKLNKVVDGVKNNLKSISDAVAKGTKDIDTKGLVSALVEAQKELGNFNDFDPKKLQGQIASLESDFSGLKATLGDVAASIEGFKDLGGFISDIGTRLKSLEISTPKIGKDTLKRDIAEMKEAARGVANLFSLGDTNASTKVIETYVKKVKDGIASIQASGNSMELFVDNGLAEELIRVLGILRQMGEPASALHTEVFNLVHGMKDAFKNAGVTAVFEDLGYRIDEVSNSLNTLTSRMKPYEDKIKHLQSLTNDWQKDLAKADQTLVNSFQSKTTEENLNAIITKIKEYEQIINEIDDPSDAGYQSAMANMLALAQATEKQMEAMGKKKVAPFLAKWSEAFGGNDLTSGNKFSAEWLKLYRENIQELIDEVRNEDDYIKLEEAIEKRQKKLALLLGSDEANKKAGRPQGTTNKKKKATDLSEVVGENFTVSPQLKIDEKKWTADINEAFKNISDPEKGKLKPIDLRINTQSTKITQDLNKIRESIENTLNGTKGSRKKDEQGNKVSTYITNFDRSFNEFSKNLELRRSEIVNYINEKWRPALKDAFKFDMTIDGFNKRSVGNDVGAFIMTYVENINAALEGKPVMLKSNIDALIEEIKTKTQNIQIEGEVGLKAGDISIDPQHIGDLNVVVNTSGLAQDDTVQKIYELLSVRKGTGNPARDARIAELRRLIAEKENAEKATLGVIKTKTAAEEKNVATIVEEIRAKEEKTKEPKAIPPTKKKEETTVHLDKAEAVAIVKEAIGGFRGKKDEVKAEAYANLGKNVLDAGNVLHSNLDKLNKAEKALYDKLIGMRDAANRVTAASPKTVADVVAPKEGETSFDKQRIYDKLNNSITQSLSTFKDADTALAWVKEEATKFRTTLSDTNAGAEELYEAEAGLTLLLAKWKYKIGNAKASKEFKYDKNIAWGKGSKANWEEYLATNGLLEGLSNFKPVSMKDFQETHGLSETKAGSRSRTTTRKSSTNNEITPVEQLEQYLENGQKLVEFYIKLAKWAKMLSPIANKAPRTITEADFEDEDTVWHNRVAYTENDLKNGKLVIDGQISESDLDRFLVDYETSDDEEFKKVFEILKTLIENHRANQERLNAQLEALEGTALGDKYGDATNKADYLATETKSVFSRAMSSRGGKGGAKLLEILGNHGMLKAFEDIQSETDSSEMWGILQERILGDSDFEGLMKDLTSVKGNMGKTYDNFVNLLKVSKEFMLTSNSLSEIGKTASEWVRGTTHKENKYRQEYDRRTGRRVTTNEIIGTEMKVVEEGLRQAIQSFAAVFVDELGRYAYGFNLGKGIVPDDSYLGGGASFSKIAEFLEEARKRALRIQFPANRKTTQGYENVDIFDPKTPKKESADDYVIDKNRFTASEELKNRIDSLEKAQDAHWNTIADANIELGKTVENFEAADELLDANAQTNAARNAVKNQTKTVERIADEIRTLENRIANPGEAFETIQTTMLQKQEELLKLQRQLSAMPSKTPKDEEARKPLEEAKKKLTSEIDRLKEKASYAFRSNIEGATDVLIAQENENISKLELDIGNKLSQEDVALKRDRLDELQKQREELKSQLDAIRAKKTSAGPDEQKELFDQEINLQHQIQNLYAEEQTLTKELSPINQEVEFLTKLIKTKKDYIAKLQEGLTKKSAMPTTESLNAQLVARTSELEKAKEDQARLEAQYANEQKVEQDIIAQEIEALRTSKTQKEARIGEIGASSDEKLIAEKARLEADIADLDKRIDNWINNPEKMISTISQIKSKILDAEKKIEDNTKLLEDLGQELSQTDKNEKYDSQTYAKAIKDLPNAKRAKELATKEVIELVRDFTLDKAYAGTKIDKKVQDGIISHTDAEALKKSLADVNVLNDKFVKGQLQAKDYIEQVAAAYVEIYRISGLADDAQAKADAERLTNAKRRELDLEQEIVRLERIAKIGTGKADVVSPSGPFGTEQSVSKNATDVVAEFIEQKAIAKENTEEFKKQLRSAQELSQITKGLTSTIRELQKRTKSGLGDGPFSREHHAVLSNDKIAELTVGTHSLSKMKDINTKFDTRIHTHPNNIPYSGGDFESMRQLRNYNPSYNSDVLVTPDFVYRLENIQNISDDTLKTIGGLFDKVEKVSHLDATGGKHSLPMELQTAIKDSLLYYAKGVYGLEYSKLHLDGNNVTDITRSAPLDESTLNNALLYVNKLGEREQIAEADTVALQKWNDEISRLLGLLNSNPVWENISQKAYDPNVQYRQHLEGQRDWAGTYIQDAINQGWDLGKFLPDLQRFVELSKELGLGLNNSSLQKISQAIELEKTKDLPFENPTQFMESIRIELERYFGRATEMIPDIRAKEVYDAKGIQHDWDKSYPNGGVIVSKSSVNKDDASSDILKSELATLLAERDAEEVDPRFATVEKQNEIIEILKAGIKVNGKITAEKSTTDETTSEGGETKETTSKEKKKKAPKIPTVGKVDIQSDEIKNLKDIDKSWDIYKSYISAKEQLDNALADAKEKGVDFTVEDADKIRAIKTEVLNLGKGVISASEQFTALKERSEDATNSVKIGTTDVKADMMQLAQDRAIADKALITDVSFDEAKQRMTAVLTDMNGQTTRLTMNYYEMFDAIVTSSDKTTDSVRKIYKAIEGEMQRFTEAKNLTDDVFGKPILKQSEEYKKYFAAYNKMLESANTVRDKGALATEDEKNELIKLRKEVETTYQAFAKMAKASADFDAKVGNNVVTMNGTQNLEAQMKAFVLNSQEWTKHQRQMIEESWKFNEAQNSASYAVEKNKGQLASMSVIADMGAKKIGQYTEETKKYKSGMEKFLDSLKNKWQEVARYLLTFGSMYRVLAVLRQGITYVKEIDSALTELKKVTDETEESYDRFLKTAAKTADKVGSTIKEIVSSTADWARIGYNLQEAATLAESTAVLLNVSEFQSIDEATSALTSTLQAFSYTAEQSMDVVDVLNEVGNNFAVSSDGIATALKDSASSLVAANNTYEEAVALIASANRVVQDPGSVGAALRTISLRLRGTSTKELEEAGEDTTGVVESKSKLRTKIQGYTGVDILTDTGAYKSTYEILLEISEVWDDLADTDQAGLLELIAGKTRSNTAAAILSNGEDLKDALEAAQNAEGSALAENEKYLDSIQGKLDQFNNAVQTMWANTLDDEWIKSIVEVGTQLVKILDTLGPIRTLIAGIAVYLNKKYNFIDFGKILSGFKNTEISIEKAKEKLAELEEQKKKLGNPKSEKNRQKVDALDQEINKYKEMLAPHEDLIAAQDKLQKAQNRLANTKSTNPKTIQKYQREVDKAKLEVNNLTAAQKKSGKTGQSAFTGLGKSVKKFGKQVASVVTQMLVMWAITKVIELLVQGVDNLITTAEEAAEKYEELNSELDTLKDNIKDINDEISTLDDKIAELTAKGSLSFTEKEELERLRAERKELERTLELNQQLANQKQQQVNNQTSDQVEYYKNKGVKSGKTTGEHAATGAVVGGAIGVGATAAFGAKLGTAIGTAIAPGVGSAVGAVLGVVVGGIVGVAAGAGIGAGIGASEEKVGESIDNMEEKLEEKEKAVEEARAKYQNSGRDKDKEKYEKAQQALSDYRGEMAQYFTELDAYYQNVDLSKEEDPEVYKRLKEEMNDFYNERDKWLIKSGADGAESNAIERIFSKDEYKDASNTIDSLVEKLKKDPTDQNVLNQISVECEKAKEDLDAVGLSVDKVKDYFTMLGQDAAFGTLEGKTKEITSATSKLQTLLSDTKSADFTGLFGQSGEVNTVAIAEYFQGTSEATRTEIARLVKNINEGEISVKQALASFAAYGVVESWKIIEAEVSELNTDVFSDLGDEISGVINTVKELSSAFESVASSIELVDKAQAEMAYSGHLSVETALQLMESTDDWNKVLKIEEGNIKLVDGAEQVLVQTKLDLIKKNLQTALSTVEAQLAQISATEASADMAYTIEESTNLAVTQLAGNMAYLTEMMTAYTKAAAGEKVDMSAVTASAEAAKKKVLAATDYQKNAAERIGREELEKEKARLEAMLGMYATVNTPSEFKSNYYSDEVSGGNATKKDATEDKIADDWEKLINKYENELALITNERDRVQAEIDKVEARGGQASKEMYDDLIRLELEEKQLLKEKHDDLKQYLKDNQNSIDPETWTEYNNEINATAVAIEECTSNIYDFAQSLREIDMHYFEQVTDEISRLAEEIDFVMSLFEDEDMSDEAGNWTEAGITKINLMRDQMTAYASLAKMWGDRLTELQNIQKGTNGLYAFDEDTKNAIAADFQSMFDSGKIDKETYDEYMQQLNEAWTAGGFSEEIYNEWVNEAEDGMRDAISAQKDVRDEMLDMWDAYIDKIEEGIEKEIEAYEDLIDAQKEELDAARELHDFRKQVVNDSKDIQELERRIASLSGSTAASDVAERRKLQAQLRDKQGELDDRYYDHAHDARSNALDDESNAFAEAKNRYVENMRETAKDTEWVINEMITNGIFNADVANDFLLRIQETYNIPLSTELTTPWATAAEEAVKFKNQVGIIAGTDIPPYVTMISSDIRNKLATDDENNPWNQAIAMADKYADFLTDNEFSLDNKDMTTFEGQINSIIGKWKDVKTAADNAYNAQNRTYNVGGNPNVGNEQTGDEDIEDTPNFDTDTKGDKPVETPPQKAPAPTRPASPTRPTFKKVGDFWSGVGHTGVSIGKKSYNKALEIEGTDAIYYPYTNGNGYKGYIRKGEGYTVLGNGKMDIHSMKPLYQKYAKGTTGTSRDEWAITDEPQFGDELVLVPGKDGNLSFMRKGTGVVPADMTQKLFELAQIPTSDLMNKNLTAVVPNITKNDFKNEFNFESLVHVNTVDSDTLPKLEKMVDKKIDDFSKALNYSLKRFAR